MKNTLTLLAILSLFICVNSCSKDAKKYTDKVTCNETDDSLNTYTLKIAGILNTNCALSGCHSASSHKGGRDYSSYNGASSKFDGNALCSINHDGICPKMPRNADKLPDEIIHDLTCWVKNGYPQ